MDDLERARGQLVNLQRQRDVTQQRVADLAAERERIAYDAATGDRAAAKALDALTQEATTASLRVDNVDHAIAEGRRRLAAAEASAARENDRERARQARALLIEMESAGGSATSALDRFVSELERFQALALEISRLVPGAPGHNMVRVHTKRAVQTALYRVGLGQLLSPSERIELADLVARWSGRIEVGIGRLLDEPPAEEAA